MPTKTLGFLAAVLLLPSCATSRRIDQSVVIDQSASTAGVAGSRQHADNFAVAQAAYQQEGPEDERMTPAPRRPEIAPLPGPIAADNAEAVRLTLEDLEQMAFQDNPSIAEAWAYVQAARGKWVQAGLPPNPRLGYSGQQLGSRGLAEQQGVYLEQEFIRGGKLRLDRAMVSREIAQAEQQLESQRRRVITDVRIGYYTVLSAQKRLELTEELVRIGNQATGVAESLFENQEGSRRDLLQARIESRSAQTFLQQARNRHVAAWRVLAAVIGSPEMPPAPLSGQWDEQAPELDWEDSLQRLRSESPEITAAMLRIERARWAVDRAHAQSVPDVNVQGIIQHDNSTGSSNGSLLVSLPIPVLNQNQGGVRQAQNDLIAARRAAQRLELAFQQRLAPIFERYISGKNRVESYRNGILQDARESLELTRQGYQAGELGFLNLLTAQRTYSQANLGYVEALADLWTASAEIEGLLLVNSLQEGASPAKTEELVPATTTSPGSLPSMAGAL
jgi:cobalt-zinc-cadmium efflux system outer membrane protein